MNMAKAALSKEDFRLLMKQRAAKKIESPFAKYDSAGQLACILCKCPVKSEASWIAHVNGKQHLQLQNKPSSTAAQKAEIAQTAKPGLTVTSIKRPVSPPPLSSSSFSKKQKASGENGRTSDISSTDNLPAGFFDSSEPEAIAPIEASKAAGEGIRSVKNKLPDNFFDKPNKNTAQRIERDKKAREEEEWNKFQREIQEESHKSAVVVEQDDDEAEEKRDLEELEEQMERWRKVMDLEKKKETALTKSEPAVKIEENVKTEESDEEEEDFEFLDWRKRRLF